MSQEFVKKQQVFEYTTIGLVGMSQGGWIAPIAASKSGDVSFVVSMASLARVQMDPKASRNALLRLPALV